LLASTPARAFGPLRAHVRAARVLARTLDLPGTRSSPDSAADVALGGWPAVTVRPRGAPPWPAVMFANGATPDGRAHAGVRRFGASLARAGYMVFIPELPGVAAGELSLSTLAACVECAVEAANSAEARNGRIGLLGVSVGGTLALLAAATPDLSARISVVACIAPFTDLKKVMMLATTGMYPGPDGRHAYPVPPALPVGVARSLVGSLDPTPDARALGRALESLDPAYPDPLSRLRDAPCGSLGPAAAATRALLVNRDPACFECLFAALPDALRGVVASLSPLRSAARISAPIEIATAPHDKYFPLGESLALRGEVAGVRITVTSALAHATPRLTPRSVADFAQLQGFIARSLGAAASC
jgi:pimeloyl-ACP methyl ester carboxylesterase